MLVSLASAAFVNKNGENPIAKLDSKSRDDKPSQDKDGPRVNRDIMARQVRLVGADGEMQGVVGIREALEAAEAAGLDLVEISPNAEPPVCKILDYGKYKYEMHKKAAEARKKQKIVEVKEIKLRPVIDDNDLNIKMKAARGFLEEGDKVKVTLKFRGREMAHQELGMNLLAKVKETLADVSKVEYDARFEGRQIVMILGSIHAKA
jgi:translation initiation factor IF-3